MLSYSIFFQKIVSFIDIKKHFKIQFLEICKFNFNELKLHDLFTSIFQVKMKKISGIAKNKKIVQCKILD